MFKQYVQRRLESYVRQYFRKHPSIKLVVVTGSVGKTSTKVAIGTVLAEKYRVRVHEGNHNSEISAPLAMMGIEFPDTLRNPRVWQSVFKQARQRINQPDNIEVIVQELGSDRIGQVPHFGTYIKPDVAVVTGVSAEHMEYFKTIDSVATEELSVGAFSDRVLVNQDDVDQKYLGLIPKGKLLSYGMSEKSEYSFAVEKFSLVSGFKGIFRAPGHKVPASIQVVGRHNVRPAVAAGAVGALLDLSEEEIKRGLSKIQPVSGRMQVLKGKRGTTILDDTYNSSPLAADAALAALYEIESPQRIAVLGSMNELGSTSAREHETLGTLCDPSKLDLVVTVGADAKEYLAPAAIARGCKVHSLQDSRQAGEFVKEHSKTGATILFKGSQGGVFLEEGIKKVLASPKDASKLVRQSAAWMKQKEAFFNSVRMES